MGVLTSEPVKSVVGLVVAILALVAAIVNLILLPVKLLLAALKGDPDRDFITTGRDLASYKYLSKNNPMETLEDIPAIVGEMRESFNTGVSLPVKARIAQLQNLRRMFTENEEAMLEAIRADLGRPKFEAIFYDVLVPVGDIDYLIGHLRELTSPQMKGFDLLAFPGAAYTSADPLGVCLIIGTWNYPIMLSLLPLAGAIAGGNCVVLKPCVVSSHSARLMAQLLPRYMDARVVTVVGADQKGDRHTTAALLREKFDHIFFTGSPSVGRVIMRGAAEHLTPVTLELGGKNPVFVASRSDVDMAAKRTVWGRMLNAGQQCIGPDYVLVEEAVCDDFLASCKKYCADLYGPKPGEGNIGRIVGDKQMNRLLGILENHGGDVICGGDFDKKERYIAPTVIKVGLDSPAMEDETFGPILIVVSVPSMDAAIDYVNSKPKPLSLYLFAKDKTAQDRIIRNTSAGGVTVNGCLFHAAHPELPFGGVGNSGMGSYHGRASFDTFVHHKPVLSKSLWPDFGLISDPFFIYPPFSDFKLNVVRALLKLH